MAKKKLTPEEKQAKKEQELIEHEIRALASGKKDLVDRIEWGFIKEPTRQFEIGEEVTFGAHDHTVVVDKDLDGKIYLIRNEYTTQKSQFNSGGKVVNGQHWVAWMDVDKKRTEEDVKNIQRFEPKDDVWFNFMQQTINSFHSIVYYFGVDMNPPYQRGLEWSLEDKTKLIDSIFQNIDIGKFAFIRRGYDRTKYDTPHMYEVLDGKQRLSTIMDFMEDRFKWNGMFFSELHGRDQGFFENYKISVAETDNMTKEQIYRYFLKLNTGGVKVSDEHMNKVRQLLEEEKNKK